VVPFTDGPLYFRVLLIGSGKTLAYLLPAFAHVLISMSGSAAAAGHMSTADAAAAAVQPHVLVLLPSRELAQQVHAQCTALFSVTGISTAVLYGGVPKEQQVGNTISCLTCIAAPGS
jgi:superfamily II DNA/RNA helicase